MKSCLKPCRNAAEVETEVRRIAENAVTHPPNEALRCWPVIVARPRTPKVFQPWGDRRDWQM